MHGVEPIDVSVALDLSDYVADGKRHADRSARIARSGLNPNSLEGAFAQDSAVRYAVERDTAGQTEILLLRVLMQTPAHAEHDLLGYNLHRSRQVHMPLRERLFRGPGPSVEQSVEAVIGHGETGTVIEEIHVEPKRPVCLDVDQVVIHDLDIVRLSVGRESHHLVLAVVHFEPKVVCKGGIEHADRMRKSDFLGQRDISTLADPNTRRCPLADAVHDEDRSLFEGRRKECTGGMGVMMKSEEDPLLVEFAPFQPVETFDQQSLLENFLLHPERDRFHKRFEARR